MLLRYSLSYGNRPESSWALGRDRTGSTELRQPGRRLRSKATAGFCTDDTKRSRSRPVGISTSGDHFLKTAVAGQSLALVVIAAVTASPIAAASDAADGAIEAPSAAAPGARGSEQRVPRDAGARVLRRALRATEAIIEALSPWASLPAHSPDERQRSEVVAATQPLVRAEAVLRTYVSRSSGKRAGEGLHAEPTTAGTVAALETAAQRVAESMRAVLEVRRTLVSGASDPGAFAEALERARTAESAVRIALAIVDAAQRLPPDPGRPQ